MKNWKDLRVGDKVNYSWNEFDGRGSIPGRVVIVECDHAIVLSDGMKLWIDQDNQDSIRID